MSDLYAKKVAEATVGLEQVALKLEHLFNANQDIKQRGGINRELAIGLESLQPGMVSRVMPIMGYTEGLTTTNYTATLESVSDTIRKMRDAVMTALKTLVKRITDWFYATFRDSKKNTDTAKQDLKAAKHKYQALQAVEEKVLHALQTHYAQASNAKGGRAPTVDDLLIALHTEAIERLETKVTKNIFVIGRGVGWLNLFKHMHGIGEVLNNMETQQAKLTKDVNVGATLNPADYNVSLNSIVGIIDKASQPLETSLANARTMQDYCVKASVPAFERGEIKTLKDPKIAQFFTNEAHVYSVLDSLASVAATGDALAKINTGLDKLESSIKSIENSEHARQVNEIIRDFKHTFAIVNTVYDVTAKLQKQIFDYAGAMNKSMDTRKKHLTDAIKELPEDLRKPLLAELEALKTATMESIGDFTQAEIDERRANDLAEAEAAASKEQELLAKAESDPEANVELALGLKATLEKLGIKTSAEIAARLATVTP